jgi:hypothetical protein
MSIVLLLFALVIALGTAAPVAQAENPAAPAVAN